MQTLSMFLYLAPKCPRAPSLSPGLCSAPGPRDSGIVPSWVRTLKASGLLSLISSLNLSLWLFPLSCSASSCLLLSSSILPAARGSSSCLCANPPARGRENAGAQGRTTDRAWGSVGLFCGLHAEACGNTLFTLRQILKYTGALPLIDSQTVGSDCFYHVCLHICL